MVRWYQRHYGKKTSIESTPITKAPADIFPPFDPAVISVPPSSVPPKARLSGPKHKQVEHVYSSLYWDTKLKSLVAAQLEIDAEFNAATGDDEQRDKQKSKSSVALRQRITHENWEAESDEVKAIVMAKRESLFQEETAIWKQRNDNLQTPEKQQMYVLSFY